MNRMTKAVLIVAAAALLGGCVGLDFSPDGKSVAISTPRGVVIMPVLGGPQELIPESKDGFMPVWSPDGKKILFSREAEGTPEVFLYDVDAKRSRKVGTRFNWPFAWREDSRRFAAAQKLEDGSTEIVWHDLTERGVAQAVSVPAPPHQIIWLPDTDDIAFVGGRSDKLDVYTIESGELRRITRTSDIIGFGLAPSRKELVWARKGANLKYQLLSIYKYHLDARSVERMTFPMRIPLINPDPRRAPVSLGFVTFSPDMKRLAAVVGFRAGASGDREVAACYSIGIDGSDARLVRKNDGRTAELLWPVWSRDSARLGVVDVRDKHLAVAVFDANGSNGARILTEAAK